MWVSALLMGLLLRRFAPTSVRVAIGVAAMAGLAGAVLAFFVREPRSAAPER
jgi:hypothetical protein